ncbi:hypothetical protein [uncultured Thiodictyon sp.]|uniref:hypothetical protein n=1 Tax=uncultured Thiodictyon sp. TaxID=1846217 RepID=UPI0025E68C47|nr:hypothetical protein [uncultured Thiodictyon sp.]
MSTRAPVRRWTPAEDAILTALSVDGGPVDAAAALAALTAAGHERSAGGVTYRLQMLGLFRATKQPWCATESAIIAAALAQPPTLGLPQLALALARRGYHRPLSTIADHVRDRGTAAAPSSHRVHRPAPPPAHPLAANDAQLIPYVIGRVFPDWAKQGAGA